MDMPSAAIRRSSIQAYRAPLLPPPPPPPPPPENPPPLPELELIELVAVASVEPNEESTLPIESIPASGCPPAFTQWGKALPASA